MPQLLTPPTPSMLCSNPFHRPCLHLILVFLTVCLGGCDPSVSKIDLDAAKSRAEAAKGRLAKVEAELKALQGEMKALTSFSGPEHDARMKQAEVLRLEKAELEGIKAEVEAKATKFTNDAKAHREAHAKEKQKPE